MTKQEEKLELLNKLLPNALPTGCRVVQDMIKGKTFAVVDKDYNNMTGRYYSFEKLQAYLMGMQEMVRYIKVNDIKF